MTTLPLTLPDLFHIWNCCLAFDEEDKPLIATHSQSGEIYTINVRLRLRPIDMDTEFVENELISRMQSITDSDATPPAGRVSIGLLNLSSIRLELQNPEQAGYYGVLAAAEDSISYVNDVPFSLSVDPAKGDELLKKINNGLITFRLVTAWNGITLDSRRVSLHISDIENTEAFQDLKAGGADLYTVDQMGDIAARIKREITFTQIDSLGGDVEEASISIDDLLNIFDPLDLANLSNERLAELEARWVERFDVGDDVDLADYQPFRVSKEVYETVKDTQDVNQIREDYLEMYDREYEKFTASAGIKLGPFSGGGTYTKEVEEMRNSKDYDFDQMKNFLEQYHEIKYDTEESLFRGLEIFDRTQMNLDSSVRITSVSVKPRGGTSSQSIQLTSRDTDHSEMAPSRVEQLIQQNTDLENQVATLTTNLGDLFDVNEEQKVIVGATEKGNTEWVRYRNDPTAIFTCVDLSSYDFESTPYILMSLSGDGGHWVAQGTSSVYPVYKDGEFTDFCMYLKFIGNLEPDTANEWGWYVNYIIIGK